MVHYRFDRESDSVVYRQQVGAPAGQSSAGTGWTGGEMVVFRMHMPSEIPYHNAPSRQTERGNILRWEQPLAARLKGEPLDVRSANGAGIDSLLDADAVWSHRRRCGDHVRAGDLVGVRRGRDDVAARMRRPDK